MFCFLQLPYHPKSTVHIAQKDQTVAKGRLYQFYSTEMTAEVMESTSGFLGQMNQKEKRMLFRRSLSEPVNRTEGVLMTSRTDPEWNMTVDSISLQSSFVDYQTRRKERLKKHRENMSHVMSDSTDVTSDDITVNGDNHNDQVFDIGELSDHTKLPSTLSLSDSDNSHSSNDITSSQAKEISYEEEMRLYIERANHLVTNVFADPFDSDERKSRTEMWVEASTEKLVVENGKKEEDGRGKEDRRTETEGKKEEVEPVKRELVLVHQSTEESLLSSAVTVSSLKKSTYKMNLKEATEAQSEIDVNDVDRFWDYLYENGGGKKKCESFNGALLDDGITSDSGRSIGMSLSPVKVEFAGTKLDFGLSTPKIMGIDEKDREVEEELEVDDQTVETKFFELQSSGKEMAPVLMRTTSSQTSVVNGTTQIVTFPEASRSQQISRNSRNSSGSDKENMIREFSFKLSENLFKDLKVLIVERDRAKEAMGILPAKAMKELSDECNYYQTRYRVRIEQNKEKLDRRIDEIWKKLLKMPIESQEMIDFISVSHSSQLTVNARRNLPQMFRHE